ncbi:hypothetical protein ACLB2K_016136 [Fragaria x ananassa]
MLRSKRLIGLSFNIAMKPSGALSPIWKDRMKETMSFKVYKLELDNQSSTTLTQVEVTNIEDQTLFVGDTPSVSVVASDFCGCRPNSIYFTDDSLNYPIVSIEKLPQYEPEGVKYDVGIFSLAERSITPYNGRHFGPPFWITTPPPFDPLPVSTATGWTRDWTRDPTGSLELTAVSKEDKRKEALNIGLVVSQQKNKLDTP